MAERTASASVLDDKASYVSLESHTVHDIVCVELKPLHRHGAQLQSTEETRIAATLTDAASEKVAGEPQLMDVHQLPVNQEREAVDILPLITQEKPGSLGQLNPSGYPRGPVCFLHHPQRNSTPYIRPGGRARKARRVCRGYTMHADMPVRQLPRVSTVPHGFIWHARMATWRKQHNAV
eukprot:TRINITY_DN12226_c0_g2_i1.p2 TRINITY_DN12226_c0_g2~~TRINITY_DN12226_c0_g2_i1.p2  ORF type:complete len:179 (+),score=9.04 TRINITY_DN12226_c0_g2_i1:1380-1916(+)